MGKTFRELKKGDEIYYVNFYDGEPTHISRNIVDSAPKIKGDHLRITYKRNTTYSYLVPLSEADNSVMTEYVFLRKAYTLFADYDVLAESGIIEKIESMFNAWSKDFIASLDKESIYTYGTSLFVKILDYECHPWDNDILVKICNIEDNIKSSISISYNNVVELRKADNAALEKFKVKLYGKLSAAEEKIKDNRKIANRCKKIMSLVEKEIK